MKNTFNIQGNIVDILKRNIFFGEVSIENNVIAAIHFLNKNISSQHHYIMPGFIDSHVHIESSMLTPTEFARLAVLHGTVGSISDPHEIANVCGMNGVQFMIESGKQVPFKFHFGAPSCVPATTFETAGDSISVNDVETLLNSNDIFYLSEMMNFPGVLNDDSEVLQKIDAAKKNGKPIDGHAPGLRGAVAKKYIDAGISTDHECFTAEEALEKLSYGMKILIREGSAAKNFDALINLLPVHYENMMFCSDDKHPDSLLEGHINQLCERAVKKGIDVFNVLQAACINPVMHYKMQNGIMRAGDAADFIVVENLKNFKVLQTYIDGTLVAKNGNTLIDRKPTTIINKFNCSKKQVKDFEILREESQKEILVIEALEGQLITNKLIEKATIKNNKIIPNIENDILKIVVVNRYNDAKIAKSFVKNFGLKKGAIASSVAHDSHNIVAVGVDDESICKAVNLVIDAKGGIAAVTNDDEHILQLPIAGLMSNDDAFEVAKQYTAINTFATNVLQSSMEAPFMTLSFMALLVIPHLKLSDKGLFDGDNFQFI